MPHELQTIIIPVSKKRKLRHRIIIGNFSRSELIEILGFKLRLSESELLCLTIALFYPIYSMSEGTIQWLFWVLGKARQRIPSRAYKTGTQLYPHPDFSHGYPLDF